MAVCEKCWDEAMTRAVHERKSVREIYTELIIARIGTPCTEEEQKGKTLLYHEKYDGPRI